MPISLEPGPDPSVVGFDAGWKLTFMKNKAGEPDEASEPLEVARSRYPGEIRVDRAASFRAGTFEIGIDGLTDSDYQQLVEGGYVFVRIELGWRDLGKGFVAALASQLAMLAATEPGTYYHVMTGRIRKVSRSTGTFHYRTEVQGIEAQFHKLSCKRAVPIDVKDGDPATKYVKALCEGLVPVALYPSEAGGAKIEKAFEVADEKRSVADALKEVSARAHEDGGRRLVPLFLTTLSPEANKAGNDLLVFGPWKAPVKGGKRPRHELTLATGLVEARPVAEESPDVCVDEKPRPMERSYDLTLLGRPDIHLGELVAVDVTPVDDARTLAKSPIGALGDVVMSVAAMFEQAKPPDFSGFRVVGVNHQLTPAGGFVTRLKVEPEPSDSDTTEDAAKAARKEVSEAEAAAYALEELTARERSVRMVLNAGDVNAQTVEESGSDPSKVHAQRVSVQEGLVYGPQANQVVNARRVEKPTPLKNKPYLTPFAFGKAGLVIPHYPGMRVLMHHYRGLPSEGVVAGALFREGDEPKSQLGDWWLCLPTQVSELQNTDDSTSVAAPSGKGTHDLTAYDGTRTINVRGFKITIGQTHMKDLGERPDVPAADTLEILHEKAGTTIKIDAQGNVTLTGEKNITIDAKETLTLKAQNVNVEVSGVMEVK